MRLANQQSLHSVHVLQFVFLELGWISGVGRGWFGGGGGVERFHCTYGFTIL